MKTEISRLKRKLEVEDLMLTEEVYLGPKNRDINHKVKEWENNTKFLDDQYY